VAAAIGGAMIASSTRRVVKRMPAEQWPAGRFWTAILVNRNADPHTRIDGAEAKISFVE